MIKRKQGPREDRRRPPVEINLLSENENQGRFARARSGCSLPFLGGSALALLLIEILQHSV